MPNKPIELPPEIAKGFVRDMKAFFKEQLEEDKIAADAGWHLPRDEASPYRCKRAVPVNEGSWRARRRGHSANARVGSVRTTGTNHGAVRQGCE
jgi:hypothetical protein